MPDAGRLVAGSGRIGRRRPVRRWPAGRASRSRRPAGRRPPAPGRAACRVDRGGRATSWRARASIGRVGEPRRRLRVRRRPAAAPRWVVGLDGEEGGAACAERLDAVDRSWRQAAGSYASRTTWRQLPSTPERGDRRAAGAVGAVAEPVLRAPRGEERRPSSSGPEPPTSRIGGRICWWRQSAALTSAASPDAAPAWPTSPFDRTQRHEVYPAGQARAAFGQRRGLAAVLLGPAAAVRFEIADFRRGDAGLVVRAPAPTDRRPGRGRGRRPRRRRGADAPDHGVDPVAVALGVVEPLQDQRRRAVAGDRAVGPASKGGASRPARRVQRSAESTARRSPARSTAPTTASSSSPCRSSRTATSSARAPRSPRSRP